MVVAVAVVFGFFYRGMRTEGEGNYRESKEIQRLV